MADLTKQQKLALARYWPQVIGGAARRATTADIFADIRDRAAELGLPSVGVSASTISTLRGYAGRMLNAARQVNKADPSTALTSQLIAAAPWSRGQNLQNAAPIYHAIIGHQIQDDTGQIVTKNQTIVFSGTLPPTVGDLRTVLGNEASLLAAEGGPADSGTPHGTSIQWELLQLLAV